MSSIEGGNITVRINLEIPDEDAQRIRKEAQELKDNKENLDKLFDEKFDESILGLSDGQKESLGKTLLEKSGLDPADITQLLSATGGGGARGLVAGGLSRAVPFLPVALALMIQPTTEAVIAELQRPGGFMDKRVKIIAQEEFFAGLDRQTRQNTRIGDREVRLNQNKGFRNNDGALSTSTYELIRNSPTRTTDIGLFDRAEGVPTGGR
jgi:hypothetical protein